MCPVDVFGGGRPEWVMYPNQSQIFLGGLDNPEKVLSSEYDFIFIPQGEEIALHAYEQLTSRATGRAGNAPYSQVMVDCNPGPPSHWILHRKPANLLFAAHKDNPTLYDHELNDWTPQGRRTIERLQSLTGLRYKRGYLGLWAGAEGQVYEDFDDQVHVINDFPIPKEWKRHRVMDFGYTHPSVVQWWAEDEDGRLYMYREMYMTKRITADHIRGVNGKPGIIQLSGGEIYERPMICDHDAEDRAILNKAGIPTVAARKGIKEGIELVQNRLRIQADGRPRMFFFRDALVEEDEDLAVDFRPVRTTEEFAGYVWREMDVGREATARDEIPVRTDDHGMDCLRYICMQVDGDAYYGKARGVSYA
jgi:phage terminase large subunit